jgi:1-deoxy-D-xylulose-5-phosphate reductoisomerase
MKELAILGSTGSIGTQTLDVVRAYPDRYRVYALCAHRSIDLLVQQAKEFHPEVVCIADESLYEQLKEKLSVFSGQYSAPKIWAGADAIAQMVTLEQHLIV